jgi:dUTP pyrophosphatase
VSRCPLVIQQTFLVKSFYITRIDQYSYLTTDHIDQHMKVFLLNDAVTMPERKTPQSAGYDIVASVDAYLPAKGRGVVGTGLVVAIPEGYYGRIASRSGLSLNHGIEVGAGVIDSDYRGEVKVLLYNHSNADFQVKKGERISQLILQKITTPELVRVRGEKELDETTRGAGGFGSTGIK